MRIATNFMITSALSSLMNAQSESLEASEQVNTGKQAPYLKGYGAQSQLIIAARSQVTQTNSYKVNNEALSMRFDAHALAYEEINTALDDFRDAMSPLEGNFVLADAEAAFDRLSGALNSNYSDTYIFSGMSSKTRPVTAATLADLQTAANVDAVFAHSDRRQTARLDEDSVVDVNATAKEIASGVFQIFRDLADFNAGVNGPFDTVLTPDQEVFLLTQVTNLVAQQDIVNEQYALNAAIHNRIDRTIEYQDDYAVYLQLTIGSMEDVDMAEAAARFSMAENAVEVSAATFAKLSQVSLLNYL